MFKPGEILKGTVIRKFPRGEILVAAKGREFQAYTTLNLKEGQRHHFQVNTTGSRIELKVLDDLIHKLDSPIQIWSSNRHARDRFAGLIRELIKAHNLTGLTKGSVQTLKNLSQLFPTIVFSDHGKDNGLWLQRFIIGSGLFWENKIVRYLLGDKNRSWKRLMAVDLKGVLLSLDGDLRTLEQDSDHIKSLAENIRQALSVIEQDQFLNLSSVREGLGWFWFIPGLKEDGFRKAELFVKEGKKEGETCFSIFLELSRLGQVVVDVAVMKGVISLKIFMEDRELANFVTENLSLLEKGIQEAGMMIGTIVCDVKEGLELDFNPFLDEEFQSQLVHLVI